MAMLDDLRIAFHGESNACVKYVGFAKRADEEGYGPVASLFRAAAAAEEIHARNHAQVIKSLGGSASADIASFEVRSTRENLAEAVQGETYERDVMYPTFIRNADGNKQAIRTFQWALDAEAEHARLYAEALADLDAWRGGRRPFWVCPTCGRTAASEPVDPCPTCGAKKEKFKLVD